MNKEDPQQTGIILPDGATAAEIVRHVNDDEFNPDILQDDGSQHKSLTAYYANAIEQFCRMIAVQIPKKWIAKDPRVTERRSCVAGIKALNEAAEELRTGVTPTEILSMDGSQFPSLSAWYKEAIIDFLNTISMKIPDKFLKKTSDPDYSIHCGQQALILVRKKLEKLV